MRAGFITEYTDAFYSAIHTDLPDIEYDDYDYSSLHRESKSVSFNKQIEEIKKGGKIRKKRRPSTNDSFDIYAFPQTWGSTALGHGGIGGAAMTSVLTVVIGVKRQHYCVYFGGIFAYHVSKPTEEFFTDLHKFSMKMKGKHSQYSNEPIEGD